MTTHDSSARRGVIGSRFRSARERLFCQQGTTEPGRPRQQALDCAPPVILSVSAARTFMRTSVLAALIVLAGWLTVPASGQRSQQRPLTERVDANAYDVVPDWALPYPKAGYAWGSNPGVFVDTDNRILVAIRGEIRLPDPIPAGYRGFYGSIFRNAINAPGTEVRSCLRVLDASGRILETWNQWDDLFQGTNGPHKIRISPFDPQRRIWVVGETKSQIYVFSNDGKQLLMTLGEANVIANDETHFGRPQDVAFLSDGSVLVADGLTNARVVKLDKDGHFMKAWGSKGSADGQFSSVHGLAVDRNDRVYVADRGNKRVQVFDANGTHLATWPNLRFPNDVLVSDATQDVWVSDNMDTEIVKFDTSGRRLYSWNATGTAPGGFGELHELAVDSHGILYTADNVLGRLQKLVPKADANPAHLIGAPRALMPLAR
jgi:streptogramin lyase